MNNIKVNGVIVFTSNNRCEVLLKYKLLRKSNWRNSITLC